MSLTFSRRQVLKAAAATAAMTVVGGCLPAREEVEPPPPQEEQEVKSWVKTVCRYCGLGCGALVGVLNEKAVAVKADPENPVNRGVFCVKGYFLIDILNADTRLKIPMIVETASWKRLLGKRL